MDTDVQKNIGFTKLLLNKASTEPCDEDPNFVMKLPEWADEKKMKMAQQFYRSNIHAMLRAFSVGLVAIFSIPSLLNVLTSTMNSSSVMKSYRRYKANAMHTEMFYEYPVEPGTKAWKSLEIIRRMHFAMNSRVTKANKGIISQKDMSATIFVYMGFHVLMPERFGIVGSREQFEAFNHFWRVIGYMLGIKDEFNCCEETLEGTRSRLKAIKEDLLLPSVQFPANGYETFTKTAVEGMWNFNPLHNNYEALMFILRRALGVPGYFYFKTESDGHIEEHKKIFDSLSLWERVRIFIDIIAVEHLSKFFIFRWLLNLTRYAFAILNVFPFIAWYKYGRENAFLDIFNSPYAPK